MAEKALLKSFQKHDNFAIVIRSRRGGPRHTKSLLSRWYARAEGKQNLVERHVEEGKLKKG